MLDFDLSPLTKALMTTLGVVLIGFWMKARAKWAALGTIPGPQPLPIIGNFLEFLGQKEIKVIPTLMRLARNYDGIYKLDLAGPFVLIDRPEYLQVFYSNTVNIDRSHHYDHMRDPLGLSVFNASGTEWKKLRRILMTNFFGTSMEMMRPIFQKAADELVAKMRLQANNKYFPAIPYMVSATGASISRSAIGEDLSDGLESFLRDKLSFCMWVVYIRNFSLLYYFKLTLVLTSVGRSYFKYLKDAHTLCKDVILCKKAQLQEMRKNGEAIPNIYVHNILENEPDMPIDNLSNELKILLVTGIDTTAGTLAFLLTCLGLHQDSQEKVFQEDKEVRGLIGERELSLEDLNLYEYVDRVIKETLRIFPVGPYIARKLSEDTYFGKYLIPKGTNVGALQMSTNHNPDIFKNPMKFDPDRWLPENSKNYPPYSFNPFSSGPRACPGAKYATILMKIIIISIIREFRVFSEYKSFEEALLNTDAEITLKDKKGCPIKLETRSKSN